MRRFFWLVPLFRFYEVFAAQHAKWKAPDQQLLEDFSAVGSPKPFVVRLGTAVA